MKSHITTATAAAGNEAPVEQVRRVDHLAGKEGNGDRLLGDNRRLSPSRAFSRPTTPPNAHFAARSSKRKFSHGTQSDDGERFIERALSASVTCRLQARSLFAYLAELPAAHARDRR